ncbi:MAG: CoA-binding protein, partial [Verrucomicrobia bacterium]
SARGRSSSLTHIDPPVEAVLLYTDPDETAAAIEDCVAAHPSIVWLHDALGPGATNPVAIERLEKAGAEVIPGLCPMLFLKPVDPGHFCIKWALKLSGKDRRVRRATAKHI